MAGEGWRGRIGVVLPSVNTVIEPFFNRAVPPGVTVHAARAYLAPQVTPEAVVAMDRDEGMRAVRDLVSCDVDSIAYCCTASSVVQGPAYDQQLVTELERQGGRPATTVTGAILAALQALGVNRIVIASPYAGDIDEAERRFFETCGLTVLSCHGMGIRDGLRLAAPEPEEIYQFAKAAWRAEAEALVLTCANFRSHSVVEALEADLGRPVITSTQAPLWRALRLAGVTDPIPGYGRLLHIG